jgi:hypothetical protein
MFTWAKAVPNLIQNDSGLPQGPAGHFEAGYSGTSVPKGAGATVGVAACWTTSPAGTGGTDARRSTA